MHIHILGICGTFMGSLAVLARQLGHQVSGSDANVYPPMSTQLEAQQIVVKQGFSPDNLRPQPDLVIIGNAMSRGIPAVEYVLATGIPYCSGPQWLAENVLHGRWVLAVAGTHGKTTTSAMLACILQYAGLKPGYLIGGVARNFPVSATLGETPFFVVEADEYDSAFFDKRSKFVHYRPRTAVLNNLEFDHGDIFPDLAAIQQQFHHLVRTIPANGLLLSPRSDSAIDKVLSMGCWTPRQQFGVSIPEQECKHVASNGKVFWNAQLLDEQGSGFEVMKFGAGSTGELMSHASINWELSGIHNVSNGLAAVAAAHHAGVELRIACEALCSFAGVKRRMELRGTVNGIRVYDDFAHHPTAIAATLQGMAARLAKAPEKSRLIAVIEPRSNTMKMGIHQQELATAARAAHLTLWREPDSGRLNLQKLVQESHSPARAFRNTDEIIAFLKDYCVSGDHVIIMSNGSFDGIHEKLLAALKSKGVSV